MQIQLSESEIDQAISDHLMRRGLLQEIQSIEYIKGRAGRDGSPSRGLAAKVVTVDNNTVKAVEVDPEGDLAPVAEDVAETPAPVVVAEAPEPVAVETPEPVAEVVATPAPVTTSPFAQPAPEAVAEEEVSAPSVALPVEPVVPKPGNSLFG